MVWRGEAGRQRASGRAGGRGLNLVTPAFMIMIERSCW